MVRSLSRKLVEALQPTFIKIVNESHLHAGHSGNPGGGPDAETHFRCASCSSCTPPTRGLRDTQPCVSP